MYASFYSIGLGHVKVYRVLCSIVYLPSASWMKEEWNRKEEV